MSTEHLIPAEFVDIYWNDLEETPDHAQGILVVDRRRLVDDQKLKSEAANYSSSAGSHVLGWMGLQHPFQRPEGLLMTILNDRGFTKASLEAALEQFSKIEECTWARIMSAGLAVIEMESAREG